MSGKPERYSRLAGIYPWLETFVFGRKLRLARIALLGKVKRPRRVLLLGDTEARMLRALHRRFALREATGVEFSEGMLARAIVRAEQAEVDQTVDLHWHLADAREWDFPEQAYDLVVTTFFLDLFTPEEVRQIVARLSRALKPGGQWLEVDFDPSAPWGSRWRRGASYRFFRWAVDLYPQELPPTEQIATEAGFQVEQRWRDSGHECRALLLSLATADSASTVRA
ncbi:MAG: class I SAM-dependent methyltransferase [Verrucomicrobiota bacterium JB022]|nr:class I SAM-dependent methyltransferase [Verrucomicrobiota bacterium JB022]